ncbi:MAG TPA: LysR family transcriptional regulator [Tepidisphaeraceae bacterium]|jgi:LysR family transcriptional activator of nhaA
MQRLNYHHLLYFWEIARHRSVSKAATSMGVSQPTVSAQLKALEKSVGHELFLRSGRDLRLTDSGQLLFRYAGEIFTLGRELEEEVFARRNGHHLRLRVGVVEAMPKIAAHVLMRPAMTEAPHASLFVWQDDHERLMAALACQQYDLVLTHEPASPTAGKTVSHTLGESGVSFLAAADVTRKLQANWPRSMHGVPMLLPTPETTLRRSLDRWFGQLGIRPEVVGEFNSACLLELFGQSGAAIVPALTLVEKQVAQQRRLRVLGRTTAVREHFYAIAAGTRVTHPGVAAICRQAPLLPDLVDGMPTSDLGLLKQIATRLRDRKERGPRAPARLPQANRR